MNLHIIFLYKTKHFISLFYKKCHFIDLITDSKNVSKLCQRNQVISAR